MPPAEGIPLSFGIGAFIDKKIEFYLVGPRKNFDDIFSRLDTVHERDGWTDTS